MSQGKMIDIPNCPPRRKIEPGRKLDRSFAEFSEFVSFDEFWSMFRGKYTKGAIYNWVNRGMPSKKIGRRLWIPKTDALVWLERTFNN